MYIYHIYKNHNYLIKTVKKDDLFLLDKFIVSIFVIFWTMNYFRVYKQVEYSRYRCFFTNTKGRVHNNRSPL